MSAISEYKTEAVAVKVEVNEHESSCDCKERSKPRDSWCLMCQYPEIRRARSADQFLASCSRDTTLETIMRAHRIDSISAKSKNVSTSLLFINVNGNFEIFVNSSLLLQEQAVLIARRVGQTYGYNVTKRPVAQFFPPIPEDIMTEFCDSFAECLVERVWAIRI